MSEVSKVGKIISEKTDPAFAELVAQVAEAKEALAYAERTLTFHEGRLERAHQLWADIRARSVEDKELLQHMLERDLSHRVPS